MCGQVNADQDPLFDTPKPLHRIIESKVHDGDLRGAARLLMSDCSLVLKTDETVQSLHEKHPTLSRTLSFPAEPHLNEPYLACSASDVSAAINAFYSGSAAELDGLRPEHLKELTSPSAETKV